MTCGVVVVDGVSDQRVEVTDETSAAVARGFSGAPLGTVLALRAVEALSYTLHTGPERNAGKLRIRQLHYCVVN